MDGPILSADLLAHNNKLVSRLLLWCGSSRVRHIKGLSCDVDASQPTQIVLIMLTIVPQSGPEGKRCLLKHQNEIMRQIKGKLHQFYT